MKFLNTGEFAKLCGVRKDTLIYYDRENLFKPKYVSENGYRHYGIEQFYDFDIITMLKETGSSLKEIKVHLQMNDPDKLLALLIKKKKVLEAERNALENRKSLLEHMISETQKAKTTVYDVVSVHNMNEEGMELFPVWEEEQATEEGRVEMFVSFLKHYELQGRSPKPPHGVVILEENVKKEQYRASYIFSMAARAAPKSARHTKLKGKYASLCHRGSFNNHAKTFKKFLDDIRNMGLTPVGNMYAYDMLVCFIPGYLDDSAMKYCIMVE